MSFIKNLFTSSKPSAEELIQTTTIRMAETLAAALAKAEESRKRPAKDEPKKKTKEKKPRVEIATEVKPTEVAPVVEVKPMATQEPVLLSSKVEPTVLSLLTEREVACLSAEETKRRQEEADTYLRTLVMNRVMLQQQDSLHQALVSKANKLLGALSGVVPSKPKSKKEAVAANEAPRVTCAALTTKGNRCRRKPVPGSTKCAEHDGEVIRAPETNRRPATTASAKPAPKAAPKPATAKPAPRPATAKPAPRTTPAPPSRPRADSEDEESDYVDSDVDE